MRRISSSVLLLFSFACGGSDSSLIETLDEPPGPNCVAGGVTVTSGVDKNGNGQLENSEIDSTRYVCNAEDALVRLDDEPAGANCSSGGIAVHTGSDLDANGMLDDDEIQQTTYVCDGDDGTVTLVRLDDELPGSNCPAGGVAVHSGSDIDGSGSLEDPEISTTTFLCNGGAGVTMLVRVDGEPAGPNCRDGGSAVNSGDDENGNGQLDDPEIDSTAFVCNGADSIVLLTDEPPGPNCASGGTLVEAGIDTNGDGLLSQSEVTQASFVCNGDGAAGLVFNSVSTPSSSPVGLVGSSLSIDADRAVLGSTQGGTTPNPGLVFERDSQTGAWAETGRLEPSVPSTGQSALVGLSGNIAVLSAHSSDIDANDAGSVWVFERDPATGLWSELQRLSASNAGANRFFGLAVDVDGDFIVTHSSTEVYFFERNQATGLYEEVNRATPSTNNPVGDVRIEGTTAFVGGATENASTGSLFVFERSSVTGLWSEVQRIAAPDGSANARFGESLDVDGETLVIAAFGDGEFENNAGSAYVYNRLPGQGWIFQVKLAAPDPRANAAFGQALGISSGLIVVGAPDGGAGSQGVAYVFELQPQLGDWRFRTRLHLSPAEGEGISFGVAVGVTPTSVLVGDRSIGANGGFAAYERVE